MYAINLLTALNASRSALPHLAASSARMYNVGAMAALQAGAGMAPTPRQSRRTSPHQALAAE